MHWASWQDFWAMGGSGGYVWGAYGVVALALGGRGDVVALSHPARVRSGAPHGGLVE